jgi:DNA primase
VKISKETIEKVQQACDIVEVVGDFVNLKKKGASLWACCPFHNEKSPSFSVTPAKQIFKCFGCGKGGDSIQFIMEHEKLGFSEAIVHLAGKYGIPVEGTQGEDPEQSTERESLLIVLQFAARYFTETLLTSEEGQSIGLSYFKERGFSDSTIEEFQLGYSLDEWEGFTRAALQNQFQIELLEKAGLVIRRDNANDSRAEKFYDRYRGRVIFPIHNVSGRVIAFGGRILKKDAKQAKYINSPETEVYHKSQVLYGLYQSKTQIRQLDLCYLVEGYTDVISLHQGGVKNVVASSGTSLTVDQIRLIKRYTPNVTILFDGDAAGLKASLRGIDLLLEEGLRVKVVQFPDGEDPDSYIRKIGGPSFQEYVKTAAQDFIRFKTELSLKEFAQDPIKKADAIQDIIASIVLVPDPIQRQVFLQESAKLLNMEEQSLMAAFNRLWLKKTNKKEAPTEQLLPETEPVLIDVPVYNPRERDQNTMVAHERAAAGYLLRMGNRKLEEGEPVSTFFLREIAELKPVDAVASAIFREVAQLLAAGKNIEEGYFLAHDEEEIRQFAIEAYSTRYYLSQNWVHKHIIVPADEDLIDKTTYLSVLRLKRMVVKTMRHELMDKLKSCAEETEMIRILASIQEVNEFSVQINRELGITVG